MSSWKSCIYAPCQWSFSSMMRHHHTAVSLEIWPAVHLMGRIDNATALFVVWRVGFTNCIRILWKVLKWKLFSFTPRYPCPPLETVQEDLVRRAD